MRWTIRRKLTSVFVLLAITSTFAVGIRAYQVSENALGERIGQGLERQASAMISQLDRMLFERYRNVQSWARRRLVAWANSTLSLLDQEYTQPMQSALCRNTGQRRR